MLKIPKLRRVIFSDIRSKNMSDIDYLNWKNSLQEKRTLSKELHYTSPLEKPQKQNRLKVLEKEVMNVPEHYWVDYVKESKK